MRDLSLSEFSSIAITTHWLPMVISVDILCHCVNEMNPCVTRRRVDYGGYHAVAADGEKLARKVTRTAQYLEHATRQCFERRNAQVLSESLKASDRERETAGVLICPKRMISQN